MRVDLLCAVLAGGVALQLPVPFEPARTGPARPVNDPVVVRGCVEGHFLKILEGDSKELFGLRDVRLKGPRGVMTMLKDHEGAYVELTGAVNLGHPDRIETRKKTKLGKDGKGGTITVAAAGEQNTGRVQALRDPVLEVAAFTPLGERCPGRTGF